MTSHPQKHWTIWVFAFGYFAFYAPYSAAVKATSKSLWPGMDGTLSKLEILPGFMLGAAIVVLSFITLANWWRFVPRRKIFNVTILCPRPLAILSGIGTAGIIIATTLAYTFHGISIVFALLLMRGGVLVMAPIIDRLFRRHVAWNSWVGLFLSLAAVSLALADQDSYVLSTAAVINLCVYYIGYLIRLQCISAAAKSEDPDAKFRYFAEEQFVSMLLLVLGCVALTFYGARVIDIGDSGAGAAVMTMFSVPTLVIGVLYGCLFLFGSMIYMDARENCFCIPINRCSSVVAGLVASVGMAYALDQPPISGTTLIAAGIIIAAIFILALPKLAGWPSQEAGSRPAVEQLLLFVCSSNVSRSPIAEAICRSEFAKCVMASKTSETGAGFEIKSAGLRAKPNQPMSPHAIAALTSLNVAKGDHVSRQLSDEMVDRAHIIYCMTETQKSELIEAHPRAADKVHCLDQNVEIKNPTGNSPEDYLTCAKHIRASILRRMDKMGLVRADELTALPQTS